MLIYSTFSLTGNSEFKSNLVVESGSGYGYLFKIGDSSNLQSVGSTYTQATVTATFDQNIVKNANALFFMYVKTFT